MEKDNEISFLPARNRIKVLKSQGTREAVAYAIDIEGYAQTKIVNDLREQGDDEKGERSDPAEDVVVDVGLVEQEGVSPEQRHSARPSSSRRTHQKARNNASNAAVKPKAFAALNRGS